MSRKPKTTEDSSPSPRPRRAKGEGSIYQREDGRWMASVTMPDGKRIARVVPEKYAETKEGAGKYLQELVADRKAGLALSRNQTVAQYLRSWLTDIVESLRTPGTARMYRWAVDDYIVPHIGRKRLRDLNGQDVQRMIAALQHEGATLQTVAYVHVVLGIALNRAVKQRLIDYNPSKAADHPTPPKPKREHYSQEELQILLEALEGTEYEAIITTVIGTGLRISECLGVSWDQLDLETGTLRVEQQLQKVKSDEGWHWTLPQPKTDRSIRTLELPQFVLDALQAKRDRQASEKSTGGVSWVPWRRLVFTRADGTPVRRGSVLLSLYRIEQQAGLPRRCLHELRHTWAQMQLENGERLEVISKLLGHSSIAITANIYQRNSRKLARGAADRMDHLVGKNGARRSDTL